MPFDNSLMLCDGSADWTFANLVTSDYGTPISTVINSGGFVILDMQGTRASGLAIALILTEAGGASDALTCIVEESGSSTFASDIHELGKFDILAVTKGVILGNECPATVVMRVAMKERYLRIDASCTTGDDFGVVYCLVSPYPFKVL